MRASQQKKTTTARDLPRRLLKHAVSLLLAGLCLFLALRNVDSSKVLGVVAGADVMWIGPAVLLLLTMNAVKCTKMGLLLSSERRIGFKTLFSAETIAILVDVAFPFRLQEIVKSILISRVERISTGMVLGAVLADRAVAGVALTALLMFVGFTRTIPEEADRALWSAVTGAASVTTIILLIAWFPNRIQDLLDRTGRRSVPGVKGLLRFVGAMVRGLRIAAQRPWILAGVFAITLLEWTLLGASFWCVSRSVAVPLGGEELLASVATIHVAFAVPSTTSGAVGIYEFAGKSTLVAFFGMEPDLALPLVLTFHVVLLGSGLIAGCLGLLLSRIGWADIAELWSAVREGAAQSTDRVADDS